VHGLCHSSSWHCLGQRIGTAPRSLQHSGASASDTSSRILLSEGIISALISTITSRPLKNGISALVEHRFGHATDISALERRFGHATTIALAALNLATGSVGCVSCRLSIRGLLFLGLCYCLLGSIASWALPSPLGFSYSGCLLSLLGLGCRLSGSAVAHHF
jgi:hypothetical protein